MNDPGTDEAINESSNQVKEILAKDEKDADMDEEEE